MLTASVLDPRVFTMPLKVRITTMGIEFEVEDIVESLVATIMEIVRHLVLGVAHA